jgi:hypothetical protein
MSNDWYLLRAGQTFGPYSLPQLQQMAVAGQLTPADLLSQGTSGAWEPPHVVMPFLAGGVPPLPNSPSGFDAAGGVAEEVLTSAKPLRLEQSIWGRYRAPILVGGGAFAVVAAVAVASIAALRPQKTQVAANVKPAPAKAKAPKGTAENRKSVTVVETVFPKTPTGSVKVHKDWVAERGAPLETHSFRKRPLIEVLVWRTGGDEYDVGIVDRATGVATLKANLSRFDVERLIDAYHLGK